MESDKHLSAKQLVSYESALSLKDFKMRSWIYFQQCLESACR